jgi:hypothetical protein
MNPSPTPPVTSHVADGMIGTFHANTQSKNAIHANTKSTTYNVQNTPNPTPSPGKRSEINLVQSTPAGKNKNKNKGKGRNKEEKIIINNLRTPKHSLLLKNTNINFITLFLSMVRIIIRNIFHDMMRLLSSCKGLGHLLHPPSCHNCFLLSNRSNWSFMTNLLPLPHLMYLCVLVTPRRMKLQS